SDTKVCDLIFPTLLYPVSPSALLLLGIASPALRVSSYSYAANGHSCRVTFNLLSPHFLSQSRPQLVTSRYFPR
ncbi:hypothetical protein CH063_01317, partial [Colletotrichum higginsianum]